jgi:peptidoglycan hydrolase-like protein with peptidoglycan-binding domain
VDIGSGKSPARTIGAAVALMFLLSPLAGCGDGTSESQGLAQANVAAKEKALADAQAAQEAAQAEFCSAGSDYVTALDRYGDLMVSTAPTVGDVTAAGSDLEAPQAEAEASAEAAVSAQEAVTAAEQDLAQAQDRLASTSASGTPDGKAAESDKSTSASPTAPPAEVTRVQQAQEEFTSAQKGISETTPLTQAGVQFNSAAVALEIAWLQLLSQAGCLSDDTQKQAVEAVTEYTKALQQDLATAGYYDGKVDGVYGPETVSAVQDLQKANDLPQTGAMDKATSAALNTELEKKGQASEQQSTSQTAALQQTLKLAGYWDGPVDGQWTPELTDAIEELQSDLGVEVTGTVDPATVSAFEKAVEQASTGQTVTATTTATATVTATPETAPSRTP